MIMRNQYIIHTSIPAPDANSWLPIITSMSGKIENLTPWTGEHGADGDASGYTNCMWDAVWSSNQWVPGASPSSGLWTQTLAEELLQDARDYYDEVIANASAQDRETRAFARWQTRFNDAMRNLQWRIDGEHRDVGPFAPDAQ